MTSRSFTSRLRDGISNAWELITDAWGRLWDYVCDSFWCLFFLVLGLLAALIGVAFYVSNIVAGELPMCDPKVETTRTAVEVRNVVKPSTQAFPCGKSVCAQSMPGKMEWRVAGVYSNPDDGWQNWEGNTEDVENGVLAVRTVTETEGEVCTVGTIYLGARNGEIVHLTKVEFHKA